MGSNNILRPKKGQLTQVINPSSPQDFTTNWVDLGEEIDVRSLKSIAAWFDMDKNDSTDMRIRALGKFKSAYQTAVDLANDLRNVLNTHLANAAEHPTVDPNITTKNFANSGDLNLLYDLTKNLLDMYAAHDADAAIASPVYHVAQTSANSLASAARPATVEVALTRLEDLRAKLLLHTDDATSHTVGTAISSTTLGDKEYTIIIESIGTSVIQFEAEYYEANVDADQKIIVQIALDKLISFVQLQISCAVTGATAAQIDSAYITAEGE